MQIWFGELCIVGRGKGRHVNSIFDLIGENVFLLNGKIECDHSESRFKKKVISYSISRCYGERIELKVRTKKMNL